MMARKTTAWYIVEGGISVKLEADEGWAIEASLDKKHTHTHMSCSRESVKCSISVLDLYMVYLEALRSIIIYTVIQVMFCETLCTCYSNSMGPQFIDLTLSKIWRS